MKPSFKESWTVRLENLENVTGFDLRSMTSLPLPQAESLPLVALSEPVHQLCVLATPSIR